MSIGIRSLVLALSLSAGLSAPAFATPFIDVRSFWEVAVGLYTGNGTTPLPPELMVTCGGTAGGGSSNGFGDCVGRRTNMPKAQNFGLPPSIGFSAVGPSISTKGRFFRPTSWCAGMFNDVCNAGWCDAADKRAPDIASIRTSISIRHSASSPCRIAARTCRARRLDDAGESRMREICTSGVTSGDWRRSYGPN